MRSAKYSFLSSDEDLTPVDDTKQKTSGGKIRSLWALLYAVVLLLSFLLNIYLVSYAKLRECRETSLHAGLEYNGLKTFHHISPFSDTNRSVQDTAWASEEIKPDRFSVALKDSYTEPLSILHAMRWPWDKEKGVYIIQGGHEVHCLQMLRNSINAYRDHSHQHWSYGHQLHCLEMLLSSVMCLADDTLLYVGYLNDNTKNSIDEAVAGEGSQRTCRSWDKLRDWADRHSACYDGLQGRGDSSVTEVDRYKSCPDGSRPWEESL